MHAPAHTCRALYDLDPTLRLCWLGWAYHAIGRLPGTASEDIRGCFGLLRVLPRALVGTPDKPKTVEPHVEELRHLGTVFAPDGSCRPDWDMTTQGAILIRTLDYQWRLSHYDVFGTGLIAHLKGSQGWLRDKVDVERKAEEQKKKDQDSRLDDVKAALAEGLRWERAKTDSEIRVVEARKHLAEEERKQSRDALPASFGMRRPN